MRTPTAHTRLPRFDRFATHHWQSLEKTISPTVVAWDDASYINILGELGSVMASTTTTTDLTYRGNGCFAMFDAVRDLVQLLRGSGEITGAVRKCLTVAEQCVPLTTLAGERGMALLALAGECKSSMRELKEEDGGGLERAKLFLQKIEPLLDENSKIVQSIADCKEMGTLARGLVTHTNDMLVTLDKAIESLPDDMQDDDNIIADTNGHSAKKTKSRSLLAKEIEEEEDDKDTQALSKLLTSMDAAIADVYSGSSQARGCLDVFTASTIGSQVFELTQGKGQLAVDVLKQMKSVNTVVADLMGGLVAETTCCTKIHAAVKSVGTLLRGKKLVQILVTASTAVQKLIDALEMLIETAWQKMQAFLEQFSAAKKIGKFVKGVVGKAEKGKKVLHNIKDKGKTGLRMFGL
jgi:flagellar biosynthesis chaperone FliJ